MSVKSMLRWSTVLAVTAIAGVAGWVSYEHALSVVRAHGESGAVAMAYPVTVDGLIYSASMVLLDSARRGVRAPALARWLLAAGIGATLLANVAAGLHFGAAGAVVAAWPALALVGSYELLMLIIRREAAPAAVATPALDANAEAVAGTPVHALVDVPGAAGASVAGVPAASTPRPRAVAPKRAGRGSGRRTPETVFGSELDKGELPSLRSVMRTLNIGAPRAREVLADMQATLDERSEVTAEAA